MHSAVIGPSWATPAHCGISRATSHASWGAAVTPHVVVGIFIVNNNPRPMGLLFLQPKVCIGSISTGSKKPGAVGLAGQLAYFRRICSFGRFSLHESRGFSARDGWLEKYRQFRSLGSVRDGQAALSPSTQTDQACCAEPFIEDQRLALFL